MWVSVREGVIVCLDCRSFLCSAVCSGVLSRCRNCRVPWGPCCVMCCDVWLVCLCYGVCAVFVLCALCIDVCVGNRDVRTYKQRPTFFLGSRSIFATSSVTLFTDEVATGLLLAFFLAILCLFCFVQLDVY